MAWIFTAEEKSQQFTLFSGYVPTFGSKAQAIDLYRCVSYSGSDLSKAGYSFTEVTSASALARLIEGEVTSINDLAGAEAALQALLLSEAPQVYVPAIKTFHENGFQSYHRVDNGLRTNLAFELFQDEASWDFLAASECVQVCDGKIMSSSDRKSKLVGRVLSELNFTDLNSGQVSQGAPLVLSDMLSVPSYLSDKSSLRARRGDGFQKRFYSTLNLSWEKAVSNIPPVVCSFSLPPLLAIVMDHADNRQDIPAVIKSLRQALAEVRSELRGLDMLATHAKGQAQIEAAVRHLEQSFSAIIPESRLTRSELNIRKLNIVQKVVRPIIRYAAGFFINNGGDFADGFNISANAIEELVRTERIVDRTLTAQNFVELVKTDSVQFLVKHHLSETEIISIEKSIDRFGRS